MLLLRDRENKQIAPCLFWHPHATYTRYSPNNHPVCRVWSAAAAAVWFASADLNLAQLQYHRSSLDLPLSSSPFPYVHMNNWSNIIFFFPQGRTDMKQHSHIYKHRLSSSIYRDMWRESINNTYGASICVPPYLHAALRTNPTAQLSVR